MYGTSPYATRPYGTGPADDAAVAQLAVEGSASLSADGHVTHFASLSLAGSATLTASGTSGHQGQLAVEGSASLSADGHVTHFASLSVSASATMVAEGTGAAQWSATATADLTASGHITQHGGWAASASASLTAAGEVAVFGALALSAQARLLPRATTPIPAGADPSGLRAWLLDADMQTPALLTTARDIRWTDQHNSLTGGAMTLQLDDPEVAGVVQGALVAVTLDGLDGSIYWIGTLLVESDPVTTVGDGDAAGRTITVAGRNHVAEWQRGTVYPPYGVDSLPQTRQRIMGFQDPTYPRRAEWSDVVATTTNVTPSVPLPPQRPEGFPTWWTDTPNDGAYWVWSRSSADTVPQGFVPFIRPWNLAADARAQIWIAADDAYELWIDDVLLLTEPGFYRGQMQHWEGDLTAGPHTIAVRAENQNPDFVGKAGLLMTVVIVEAGTGNLLWPAEIDTDELDDGFGATQWRTLDYPDPWPGMTPGEIVEQFRSESAARGNTPLGAWSVDGSGLLDADGAAWDEIEEPIEVGRSLVEVLAQLGGSVMEFAPIPGLRMLRCWRDGGRGSVLPVALTHGAVVGGEMVGNLRSLMHSVDGRLVNSLLVEHTGGLAVVEDAASIAAHERWEDYLRLAGVRNSDEALRLAAVHLAVYADQRVVTTASVDPLDASDQPFVAWNVGDWIDCPDPTGAVVSQRVRSLSCAADGNGHVTYEAELGNLAVERETALARTVSRALRGSLGGRSEQSSYRPADPIGPRTEPVEIPPMAESEGTSVSVGETGVYAFDQPTRIVGFWAASPGDGTGDTVLEPRLNGAALATITLGPTDTFVDVDGSTFPPVQTARRDVYSVAVTAAGGHSKFTLKTKVGR